MDDIAEPLAIRDRFMARMYAAMTPQERMERHWALQEFAFDQLLKSPEGFDRFIRANIRKRAIPPHEYPPESP